MTIHPTTADRTILAGMRADLYGGPDDRPALVLLPGLTFDRRIWGPVLDGLDRLDPNRHVLALDLPGHGDSAEQLPHSFDHIVALLHDAVVEAELYAPVLVGHSMSGGLASIYAARYPTRGVVNLDAPPDLASFARLVQPMAEQIRGSGFAQVWEFMQQGFRTEHLPLPAQRLVAATSTPRQELVVSYWTELLEQSPEQLTSFLQKEMGALAATGAPYLLITGAELSPLARQLFDDFAPDACVEIWPDSGHFPHLAHLERFLNLLVETGRWKAPALR